MIAKENQANGKKAAENPYFVSINDIPEGERPRERFAQVGAGGLSQRELLAIVLRSGTDQLGVMALADALLARFGGLAGLAQARRTN